MEETKNTQHVENLIERLDDALEESTETAENKKESILSQVSNIDELRDGLELLKDKAEAYKAKIDNCDQNIKMWQGSKKMWQERSKKLLDILGELIERLNIPGKTLRSGGVKLTTSSRTSLEVDEEWLLSKYQMFADALQTQLPEYVKVSISLDKNKLFAYVKANDEMLVNNPDKIHTKVTTSTSIK